MEDNKSIEEIENKMNKTKSIPIDMKNKINKEIFCNILLAIGITLYFIFLICGFRNIEKNIFLTDLKVFCLTILVVTIILFEKSYNENKMRFCIHGLEALTLAVVTLSSIYICMLYEKKFVVILALISYVFEIYYIAKDIVIYKKMKKQYLKSLSDISEIVKKEKPIKNNETKRKNIK